MRRLLVPLLLGSLASGCASFSTMGTARTIDKGTTQFFFAPQVVVAKDWSVGPGAAPGGTANYLQLELGVRQGVSDTVEVGGKLWLLGFELDTKIQLLRSWIDLALDPGVGYLVYQTSTGGGQDSVHVVSLYLPLLVDFNLGERVTLVVGPKFVDQLFLATGGGFGNGNVLWAGSTFGVAVKLGEHFALLPEVDLMYPVLVRRDPGAPFYFGALAIQGGIGLLFGP